MYLAVAIVVVVVVVYVHGLLLVDVVPGVCVPPEVVVGLAEPGALKAGLKTKNPCHV